MITSLKEEEIESIKDLIKKAKDSGKKEFRVNFNGGGSKPIEDLESLEIKKKLIIFDGRFVEINNVKSISAEGKEIIIFAHKNIRSVPMKGK